MASRRSLSPDPQIHTSQEGAGATRSCSRRLHPQIEAAEEGAEMSRRRRDGTSLAAPDDDDMLREILLRLPPQPSSLPRAAAVCWRWRRIVADLKFVRRCSASSNKATGGLCSTPSLTLPTAYLPCASTAATVAMCSTAATVSSSSETGRVMMPLTPSVLVGDCLYWTCDDVILEFDLVENCLTVIMEPPVTDNIRYGGQRQIIHAENSAVGFAILCYPHLHICQRNVSNDGVTAWLPWKTIEMHTIRGLSPQIEGHVGWGPTIRGYDEDTGAIFVNVNNSVYMVQLKLMQSWKLYKTIDDYRCHSFKSFYTPGTTIRGCSEAGMLHNP